MAKTIITAALTGAITPHGYDVPETPEAIAACAYECWKAGASVVHLHMRDDQGAGVMDPVKFYETISILRNKYPDCDVIVNCTSSGDNRVSDGGREGNQRPGQCLVSEPADAQQGNRHVRAGEQADHPRANH